MQLQFVDLFGVLKSVTVPARRFPGVLEQGEWFDGSAVDGFARVLENDMYLLPDLGTFRLAPEALDGAAGTARVMCSLLTPDGQPSAGDSRAVLRRALARIVPDGLEYRVAPEVEFFLFDATAGATPAPSDRAGYFDQTRDAGAAVREEIVETLLAQGVAVDGSHHEVAGGQHEVDIAFQPALDAADAVVLLRDAVRVVAARHGLRASFMPKPLGGANGSGMHTHQGLCEPGGGANLFHEAAVDDRLSALARHFVAGQLEHAAALVAVTACTVNSYKRLIPGFEAPTHVGWAHSSRSALIRVPSVSRAEALATRVELRCPDPACNPYLAFAAMLAAGLDGVERRLSPPPPIDEDGLVDPGAVPRRYVGALPASLDAALDALVADDHIVEALGPTLVERFVEAKRIEWEQYRAHVTDWELGRYLQLH